MFLEVSQNSQVFSGEFCEISKNIFSYRAPPVDASEYRSAHKINSRGAPKLKVRSSEKVSPIETKNFLLDR